MLKMYLRDQPEALVPPACYEEFVSFKDHALRDFGTSGLCLSSSLQVSTSDLVLLIL